MKYQMYYEMMEQPEALRKTFASELDNMNNISKLAESVDTIYLIGCGSSISTCYSIRDALASVSHLRIEVFTGYEFVYNKKLNKGENSLFISTSQSGETADTLAALRKANEFNIDTVSISNEPDSSMVKEAKYPVITLGNTETAILGTKTYITQLACLYQILFAASGYEKANEILEELSTIPNLIEELLETTEEDNKRLAKEFKDEEIFYCLGSGVNFGLAYKLAMTMLMEGAIKHACPLYSAEFRHGLIERAEEGVPLIFLDADLESDKLTKIAINFSKNKLEAKTIIYSLKDYANINPLLAPFILVIPLEWFVYYLSHFNGEDPGSTRHIGKVRYE
ncbi:SIS domain-containing protein [Methanobrevibacter olleyae]|uniref:Glucosamine--fructose-6-phosphate aminotransferase (Isomerizing) n=1 Tax=Methanobrevibacter olleyae TaxID=294671 RepID=A0A126R135_METOL|nr:SIS domain-containing protein [Methanobrevibacter olleyae]AMK15746.1 phosphosugar-binding protein [Methanobrevibacter olleyae]SFL58579.1 glucosamine--fructose-6-phosphate aminotransferase (isomerizing) [Methanobrevibacter olleyae]